MITQFDEWLRELRAARKGPWKFTQMRRGGLWQYNLRLPGDWTGATMRAQIRLYPDAPGSPLATCNVFGPFVEADGTVFQLQLAGGAGANSTGALPADGDGDGVVHLAIDVLLTPDGGEEDLLVGGIVPLLGRVTA